MGAKVEESMQRAEKLQAKQLEADTAEMERDAKAADSGQAPGAAARIY